MSFISDAIVFQNPTLQRPLWLGPPPTLWGRVLLSNGRVPACPRKCSCICAIVEVQILWQTTTHSQHQVSPHSGIFVPIPANMAVLWGPLGPLPMGRPYSLYPMLSSRGTTSPHVVHRPLGLHCLLPGIHPTSSLQHHQALNSETSDSVLHCL